MKIAQVIGLLLPVSLAGCSYVAAQSAARFEGTPGTPKVRGAAFMGQPRDPLAWETGKPGHMTLAVKFVELDGPDGTPDLDRAGAERVIAGVNTIFAGCNMHLRIESFQVADPAALRVPFDLVSMDELGPLRGTFDDPRMLVVIDTGAWNHSEMGPANAWTAMPGESPAGAVLENSVASNGGITAHELGHYLGLSHVSDTADLMNPIIYTYSTGLDAAQCSVMRQTAQAERTTALR